MFILQDLQTEKYINRLGTTTHILKAMDCLIRMSEKHLQSRKIQKHLARKFFTHILEVSVSINLGSIFLIMSISKV